MRGNLQEKDFKPGSWRALVHSFSLLSPQAYFSAQTRAI